jgi:hypothetical protein
MLAEIAILQGYFACTVSPPGYALDRSRTDPLANGLGLAKGDAHMQYHESFKGHACGRAALLLAVIAASLVGGATPVSSDVTYQTIALTGQAASGAGEGVIYSSFALFPRLNGAGEVAYVATLAGTGITDANNKVLYAGGVASPQIVARKGDLPPGASGHGGLLRLLPFYDERRGANRLYRVLER